MSKTFLYKVYDSAGATLKATWNDVVSDLSFSQQLNNGTTQTVVTLARPYNNYGEGVDISFNNQVKIYVIDVENPSGLLIFTGYIADYTPNISDQEKIDVTIFGYGIQLNNFNIESGELLQIDALGTIVNAAQFAYSGGILTFAQTWKATATAAVSRFVVPLALVAPLDPGINSLPVTLSLYTGSTPGDPTNTLLGVSTVTVTNSTTDPLSGYVNYSFPLTASVTSGSNYNFVLSSGVPGGISGFSTSGGVFAGVTTNFYPDGLEWFSNTGGNDYSSFFGSFFALDISFQVYQSGGSTMAPYNSTDPSAILKSVIDDSHNRGGAISYNNTIDLTGSTVSYTFNTNTTQEGVNKALELAPTGWYWFVDPATNYLNFHNISAAPTHTFVLGKDFTDLTFDKRSEDIINTIYFTGTGLYVKYTNPDSIASYGPKLQNYVDQRVTLRATADTIANTILGNSSQPEVRVTAEIVDSNITPGSGYDIESIKLGDLAVFRGIDNAKSPQWDVAIWDVDRWDYNIQQINTLTLQITRLEYAPGSVKIYCSTTPLDVNKRIEDINRNLNASVTVNNPSSYST